MQQHNVFAEQVSRWAYVRNGCECRQPRIGSFFAIAFHILLCIAKWGTVMYTFFPRKSLN